MIHIEKDQEILENPKLKVASETGDYDDDALIRVYSIDKGASVVEHSFQAQYVKYGGLVYKYNDARELGEAILKIDPNSTHSAASYVRMSNKLLEKLNEKTLSQDSLDDILEDENIKVDETPIKVPPPPNNHTSTTTPQSIPNTSTTTPPNNQVPSSETVPIEKYSDEAVASFSVDKTSRDTKAAVDSVQESEN